MHAIKHCPLVVSLLALVLLASSQATSATPGYSITAVATPDKPDLYKITINPQETLAIQVHAQNITGNITLGVALMLGLAANFGDTLYLVADSFNSTKDASISYLHVDTTPLYLGIFFVTGENEGVSIAYDITSSHSIVPYSYAQYYNDVVYPKIIADTMIVAIIVGGIALAVTVYFLRKRQREKALSLL